ncbi:unnamed protein product [Phytophthora fragariaefolia]|uniref:Unnamed protein product n=1 Tax=Phytophthora fragariaefolia TaxID=1490495 RepID=A0A9W6TMB1_9STRA|nr:unnamed protein product [Phytophthora fragariaefolia]
MKRVSQLEEFEKTASALARSLKEQVAQLENRNISLQELHQSTNLECESWSTERIRLDATIRDKERIIASVTTNYHRDAGNHQLVLGRCYELTAQVSQLSDALFMGNTSAHQHLKRQLADKVTRTTSFADSFARFACPQWSAIFSVAALSWSWVQCSVSCELTLVDLLVRSPILFVPGQPMPGLTADELNAFQSASETLRQGGLSFSVTVVGEVRHCSGPT